MRINLDILGKCINIEKKGKELKSILDLLGMEVDEIINDENGESFEIEITPNRPDWLSYYGVSRELKAKFPQLDLNEFESVNLDLSNVKQHSEIIVNAENKEDTARYFSVLIKNIQVKESPQELKTLINKIGLRSINNVVDISNLVLMLSGHPVHIFDYDKIEGKEINIRRALDKESLKLLDDTVLSLNSENLVIADKSKPIALAGIMGGKDSGVSLQTKNIFIESAYFNAPLIRKCAKEHSLSTDASYRFERGADYEACEKAGKLIIYYLKKFCSLKDEQLISWKDSVFKERKKELVDLPLNFVGKYCGMEIEELKVKEILNNLGFTLVEEKESATIYEVPSFRVDIYGKVDLVEEVIRVMGYHNLISEIPKTVNPIYRENKQQSLTNRIRDYLIHNGINEVMNYIFISPDEEDLFNEGDKRLELKNPLGRDYSILRTSMLPLMIKNCAMNFNNDCQNVEIMETGTLFKEEDKSAIKQLGAIAIIVSGFKRKIWWKDKKGEKWDIYSFKELVRGLFLANNIEVSFKPYKKKSFEEKETLKITVCNNEIGFLGRLCQEVTDNYKIKEEVYCCEFMTAKLIDYKKINKFQVWNKFPQSNRDLSFFIDDNVLYDDIVAVVEKVKPLELEQYRLVDRYKGKNLSSNSLVSLSMQFIYRAKNKTLTNEEINIIHEKLVHKIEEELKIKIR